MNLQIALHIGCTSSTVRVEPKGRRRLEKKTQEKVRHLLLLLSCNLEGRGGRKERTRDCLRGGGGEEKNESLSWEKGRGRGEKEEKWAFRLRNVFCVCMVVVVVVGRFLRQREGKKAR